MSKSFLYSEEEFSQFFVEEDKKMKDKMPEGDDDMGDDYSDDGEVSIEDINLEDLSMEEKLDLVKQLKDSFEDDEEKEAFAEKVYKMCESKKSKKPSKKEEMKDDIETDDTM